MRFRQLTMRGKPEAAAEWAFAATVHNLFKAITAGHLTPAALASPAPPARLPPAPGPAPAPPPPPASPQQPPRPPRNPADQIRNSPYSNSRPMITLAELGLGWRSGVA